MKYRNTKELTLKTLAIFLTFGSMSQIALLVKNLPATQETLVQFLDREDLLEKG